MWWSFCAEPVQVLYQVSANRVLNFLVGRFGEGVRHGTLNSARAALSLISTEGLANHALISRFIKGAFKQKPSRPRHDNTWDVDPVLSRLGEWQPVESLVLKTLSKKLVVLLALGSGQRIQTLSLIKICNITETGEGIEIKLPDRVKTTRVGSRQPVLRWPKFQTNPGLCIVNTLSQYLKLTGHLRNGEESLLITLNRPNSKVQMDTIARWIKDALTDLGVSKQFSAYITRDESTSKADSRG